MWKSEFWTSTSEERTALKDMIGLSYEASLKKMVLNIKSVQLKIWKREMTMIWLPPG